MPIKNIIIEQKIEKERLSGGKYVPRDNLRSAKEYLNNDLIKVIIGPRRAGKSVFALQLLADYNFAYINFDDERLLDIDNYDPGTTMKKWISVVKSSTVYHYISGCSKRITNLDNPFSAPNCLQIPFLPLLLPFLPSLALFGLFLPSIAPNCP